MITQELYSDLVDGALAGIYRFFKRVGTRNWVKICLFVLFIIGAWLVFINFCIVHVIINNRSSITLTSGSSQGAIIQLPNNTAIISRTKNSITANSGDYSTIIPVAVPWYGFATARASINNDMDAETYFPDSQDCMFYDNAGDRVISFACQDGNGLFDIDTSNGNSRLIQHVADYNIAASFMNGVLTIADSRMFYEDTSGTISYLTIPKDMSSDSLSTSKIYTDTTTRNNPHFVVTTASGNIFVGTYNGGDVTFIKITKPTNWVSGMKSICDLVNQDVTCYQGRGTNDDDTDGNAMANTLLKINLNDNIKPTVNTYPLDSNLIVTAVATTGTSSMLISNGQAYAVEIHNNKVTQAYLTDDASSVVASGGKFYLLRNNKIYSISTVNGMASMYFYTKAKNIKQVIASNGGVFFTAAKKDSSRENIYKITQTSTSKTGRLVDLLPFDYKDGSSISDLRYYKNIIYVNVKITIAKLSLPSINQSEYLQAQENALRELQDNGIVPSKYTIKFSY